MSTVQRDPAVCAPRAVQAMGDDVATVLATRLRALADPARLRMLSMVVASPTGEACVCDLGEVTDLSQPTVSHHLKVLKDVGLLVSERRGTWVHYRVAPGAESAVASLFETFAPAVVAAARGRTVAASAPTGRETVAHGLLDGEAVLGHAVQRLQARFDDVDPGLVERVVRESYTALVRTSRLGQHVPVLAERFARQRLEDLVRAGRARDGRPQVLFVCVANAGRSQLAAALLAAHAGDAVVVRSAGSAPADDVHDAVRPVLEEILGSSARSSEVFPKPLTDDALRAADVVVTMGCGDSCPVLPGTRYEDWAIADPALASPEGVRAIRDEIDARVRALADELLTTPSSVRTEGEQS